MIDLSEEPIDENIELCRQYFERMAKINCLLEIELGITGGEEVWLFTQINFLFLKP